MNTYTGSTLDEMLEKASEDLGTSVEELEYNVTDEQKDEEGNTTSVTADVFTLDDVKEFLFDYLGNYFTGIELDVECAIEERDKGFIVNLNADNNAVLIGKMGKTLAAFNTVVRAAVNSHFKKRIDVLIDVNHYKENRYSRLRSMAKRTAKQVQRSHVDAELDPMPNDERKVIHKALNEWHNIRTESEGEGSARHVCIRYVPDEEEPVQEEEEVTVTVEEETAE